MSLYKGTQFIAGKPDTTGLVPTTRTVQGKPLSSNITFVQNEIPIQRNTLASSGTIALSDLSVNYISTSGAVTFTLPSVSDNTKFHQIIVQVNMSSVVSINVGTTYYFNKTAPDLSEAGTYDLIWEYDGSNWVAGLLSKGAEE